MLFDAISVPGLEGLPLIGALGTSVGFVLGLLGGGGSILALPMFLEVFHEPPSAAIAESLLVVAVGAGAGLLAKLQAVDFREIAPLCAFAMLGSIFTARLASDVPGLVRLGLFTVFAAYSAVSMLLSARGTGSGGAAAAAPQGAGMSTPPSSKTPSTNDQVVLWALLFGVGALTSVIGAGGGFVIVPILTRFARMEMKPAVASSLLIICLNSVAGFTSFLGLVPIKLELVLPFAGAAAVGALLGNACSKAVSQRTVKLLFACTILVFGTGLVATKLPPLLSGL